MEMPSSPSCELGMMVEGSGLVLRAHVLRTRPSTITCAVPLVGIRLGGTVRDERGRRARIRRIALATDHDTPQLIFELAYEGEPITVEGASSPSSPPHSLHQLPFTSAQWSPPSCPASFQELMRAWLGEMCPP